jgi:hypothetical protein
MTQTSTQIDYDTGYEFEGIHGEHFRKDVMLTPLEARRTAWAHGHTNQEYRDQFGHLATVDAVDLYIWLGY